LNTEKLEALQKIEVGLLDYLPRCFVGDILNKKANCCVICKYDSNDILVLHHIFVREIKGYTAYTGNGLAQKVIKLLGEATLCPNCHALIHKANPFTKIKRPSLYDVSGNGG